MTDNPYASPNPEKEPVPQKSNVKFRVLEIAIVPAVIIVVIAMLLPNVQRAREPARRTQCKNNLKWIGLALHQYHDTYGTFPPAYTVDADGKRLHSWRTLILPFFDQADLYKKIDLSKAWDDPVNSEVAKTVIPNYSCPDAMGPRNHAYYVAIVGRDTCFPGVASRSLAEIKDSPSQTLAVVEVTAENAVPWMSPMDVDDQYLLKVGPKSKLSHAGGLHGLMADGTVRLLSYNTDVAVRSALMTIAGNEVRGDF